MWDVVYFPLWEREKMNEAMGQRDRAPSWRIEVDEEQQSVRWWIDAEAPRGACTLRLPDNVIELAAHEETGAGLVVQVTATRPFRLEIVTPFAEFVEQAPAGVHSYLLTYLDRTDVYSS